MVKWIEYLNYRTDYECLIDDMIGIPIIYRNGTEQSMRWFLEHAAKGNRFRRGYQKLFDTCLVGLIVIEEMKEDNDAY
jgi:hypothetical protein